MVNQQKKERERKRKGKRGRGVERVEKPHFLWQLAITIKISEHVGWHRTHTTWRHAAVAAGLPSLFSLPHRLPVLVLCVCVCCPIECLNLAATKSRINCVSQRHAGDCRQRQRQRQRQRRPRRVATSSRICATCCTLCVRVCVCVCDKCLS